MVETEQLYLNEETMPPLILIDPWILHNIFGFKGPRTAVIVQQILHNIFGIIKGVQLQNLVWPGVGVLPGRG